MKKRSMQIVIAILVTLVVVMLPSTFPAHTVRDVVIVRTYTDSMGRAQTVVEDKETKTRKKIRGWYGSEGDEFADEIGDIEGPWPSG